MNTTLTSLRKAKGSVLVITALALFVLMGMAALAIDLSHGETNKTRLQNLADALALSAAISLNKQDSSAAFPDVEQYAENYAKTITLPKFETASGNNEVTLADNAFTFTFATDWSATGADWKAAGAINGAKFVRVESNSLNLATWFGNVLGFANMTPSASAVAGTTPIVPCSDVLPVIACKGTDSITGKASTDKDCSDGNCYGYATNTAFCFKSSPTSPTGGLVCPDIPPEYTGGQLGGNFGWMDVGAGGADLKACAAGDPTCQQAFCESFAANGTVTSKTGDVASVDQGFNTRFDDYNGSYKNPALYPPDRIVGGKNHAIAYNQTRSDQHDLDAVNFPNAVNIAALTNGPVATTNLYKNYYKPLVDATTTSDATHAFQDNRRVLSMPFVDCSAITKNAKGTWDVPASKVDWGCVFITRPIPVTGSLTPIYAEVIDNSKDDCMGMGKVVSNVDTGIYKVQLYKDPFGGHS